MKKFILLALITSFTTTITRSQSHIDSTFGVDGSIFTALDTHMVISCIPLIQSDGKIVLAGCSDTSNSKGYVARYHPDGSIDSTFGVNGKFESDSVVFLSSIIQLSNGKLLLGGAEPTQYSSASSLINHRAVTLLLDTNGTIDTTFGNSGIARAAGMVIYYDASRVTHLEELPSGKLLLYGTVREYDVSYNISYAFTMMYHSDGSIDSTYYSWGSHVYYNTYPSAIPSGVSDVVSYGSQRLILGTTDHRYSSPNPHTTSHQSLSMSVLDTAGSFDTTLIAAGTYITLNEMKAMRAIRRDSTLLIAGFGSVGYWSNGSFTFGNQSNPFALKDFFALKRYNLDGSIDSTFGTTNGQTFTVIDSNTAATDMEILYDGRIIVVGVSTSSGDSVSRLTIARYTENGHLDSTCFDAIYKGLPATHSTGPYTERTPSIVRVENNTILVASVTHLGGNYGFQMTSYNIGLNHSIEATAYCEYQFNGETYNESGVYYDTLNSSNGCDSIIALELTIESIFLDSHQATACDAYVFEGTSYNSSGVYFDTLLSSHGCDSIIELDLKVHHSESTELEVEACDLFSWNGTELLSSGIYVDTLQTVHGCDSIVELDLTINSADAQIAQDWDSLISTTVGETYQWIDCESGLPLVGDTTSSYVPDSNGSYALVIQQNGCMDTSDCMVIGNVGSAELSTLDFQVYPNPSSGSFNVMLGSHLNTGSLRIYSLTGDIVMEQSLVGQSTFQINTSLPAGVYLMQISSGELERVQRLIIGH